MANSFPQVPWDSSEKLGAEMKTQIKKDLASTKYWEGRKVWAPIIPEIKCCNCCSEAQRSLRGYPVSLPPGPCSGRRPTWRRRGAAGSRNPPSRAQPASLIWDLLEESVLVAPTPHIQTGKGKDKTTEGKTRPGERHLTNQKKWQTHSGDYIQKGQALTPTLFKEHE